MIADTVAVTCAQQLEMAVTTPNDLSDGALAVFAFAAYHQLASGDVVTSVVAKDGAGHKADPVALDELETKLLGNLVEERFVFTPAGQLLLSQVLDRIRGQV